MKTAAAANIDDYIAPYPPEVRARLTKVRETIQQAAPDATEKISYQIPTFALHGNLVHFAAFERHIGFYPGAAGIASFAKELESFASAKGSVQFPHDRAVPYALIRKIVKFRVAQNLAAHAAGAAAKRAAPKKRRKKG